MHGLALVNRRFLARGIEYALGKGVNQIIDIRAGVPSVWLTHHVTHALRPKPSWLTRWSSGCWT